MAFQSEYQTKSTNGQTSVKLETVSVSSGAALPSAALSPVCRPALSCYESVHLNLSRCASWRAGCHQVVCQPAATLVAPLNALVISHHRFTFTILSARKQIL